MQSPAEKGNLRKLHIKRYKMMVLVIIFFLYSTIKQPLYTIFSIRNQARTSKSPLQVIDRFSQWVNNLSKQKLVVFILVMTNGTVTEINIRIRQITYF